MMYSIEYMHIFWFLWSRNQSCFEKKTFFYS